VVIEVGHRGRRVTGRPDLPWSATRRWRYTRCGRAKP